MAANIPPSMLVELLMANRGATQAPGGRSQDAYAQWLKQHGVREDPTYDTRAAFAAGVKPDANGHMEDTYKMPTHPTFSSESIHSSEGQPGGEWLKGRRNTWVFEASPWNLENMSREQLMDYFDRVEPGNTIRFPGGGEYVGGSRKAPK